MNRNEILRMKPGRELNALVAEKVMGWTYFFASPYECLTAVGDYVQDYLWRSSSGKWELNCPPYSTDIAAAWEVVEKFDNCIKLESWEGFIVEICNPVCRRAHARTAPEAICKAALLALEGGEESV